MVSILVHRISKKELPLFKVVSTLTRYGLSWLLTHKNVRSDCCTWSFTNRPVLVTFCETIVI